MNWMLRIETGGASILLKNIKPFKTRALARECIANQFPKGVEIRPVKVKITYTEIK